LPIVNIETLSLNIDEAFQALMSIIVNSSYFFFENLLYTLDLEKLA
ncbi:unnamed protein product, partial [Rotaria sp. Silwood2]